MDAAGREGFTTEDAEGRGGAVARRGLFWFPPIKQNLRRVPCASARDIELGVLVGGYGPKCWEFYLELKNSGKMRVLVPEFMSSRFETCWGGDEEGDLARRRSGAEGEYFLLVSSYKTESSPRSLRLCARYRIGGAGGWIRPKMLGILSGTQELMKNAGFGS